MGILDSVIGGLLGGGQGQNTQGEAGASPLGGIISSVLGGGQGGGEAQALGGLASAMGGAGGVGALLQQFQGAGLGHLAESWIGNGANQPVSPDQLQSVFGADQTRAMADQAGMDHGDFLQQLSQALPQAVDGATSNGVADDGSMNV